MAPDNQREWARLGAQARLSTIDQERTAILKAFPELRSGRLGSPKRRFSAEARKRMSAGMRKFWARRKAAAKKVTAA
jgi:hypothetical protein